jgi:hypothetical protein
VKGEDLECSLGEEGQLVITGAKVHPRQLSIKGAGAEKSGAKLQEGEKEEQNKGEEVQKDEGQKDEGKGATQTGS